MLCVHKVFFGSGAASFVLASRPSRSHLRHHAYHAPQAGLSDAAQVLAVYQDGPGGDVEEPAQSLAAGAAATGRELHMCNTPTAPHNAQNTPPVPWAEPTCQKPTADGP
jgi:hypothetical protein